jgi:hypothetical protein
MRGCNFILGAMAGAKMTRQAKNYAIQKGFFVIEPAVW